MSLIFEILQAACVAMDESDKGGEKVVIDLSARRQDGSTSESGLPMLSQSSKKAGEGGTHCIEAIEELVTRSGLPFITIGMSDAASAAYKVNAMLMIRADDAAVELAATDPDALLVRHPTLQGLQLDRAGRFREELLFTCAMHNDQAMLKPLLITLVGAQGLGNNAALAQLMYSLSFTRSKAKHILDSLAVDEARETNTKIKLVKNVKQVTLARWMSTERTASDVCDHANQPASAFLQNKLHEFFGEEEWLKQMPMYSCFDSEAPSRLILETLWIANHSTENISKNAQQLVSWLCSPSHRLALVATAELFPIHLELAKFEDGKSGTHPENTNLSCRLLEGVVHDRNTVALIEKLVHNWKEVRPQVILIKSHVSISINPPPPVIQPQVLPRTADFLKAETERARRLGWMEGDGAIAGSFEAKFDKRIVAASAEVQKQLHKYKIAPKMSKGQFFLNLQDPSLAPHTARALLRVLKGEGYVDDIVIPSPPAAPTRLLAQPEHPVFSVDSSTHAFPKITFDAFEEAAVVEFKKGGPRGKATTKGLVKALALDNPRVVSELSKVAAGELAKNLSGRGWRPGASVATYWDDLAALVPAIAWVMARTFGHGRRTNTKGECFFSVCNNVLQFNAALSTNAARMMHHTNVRHSALVDYQKAMQAADSAESEELPRRLLRSESSRLYFAQHLHVQGERVSLDVYSAKIEDISGESGKKRKEMTDQHAVSSAEQNKNQKTARGVVGLSKVVSGAMQFENAYQNGLNVLPSTSSEIGQCVEPLPKHVLQQLLEKHCPDDADWSTVNKTTGNDAPEGYVNLVEALTEFYEGCGMSLPEVKADVASVLPPPEDADLFKTAAKLNMAEAKAELLGGGVTRSTHNHSIDNLPKNTNSKKYDGDCLVDEIVKFRKRR